MIRIYLHPLPLRIWHWLNALVMLILITTGVYLRIHGVAMLKPHDPVLLWHKYAGLALIITTIFWIIYTLSNKNQRCQHGIKRSDFRGIFVQAKFYLYSIFKGVQNPFSQSAAEKYNPLQKISYDAVMFIFMPVQLLTGLLFMDVPLWRQYLVTGSLMSFLGFIHVMFAYLFVLYFIVHLYMATMGETVFTHTKAMIVGYKEEQNDDEIKKSKGKKLKEGNEK